MQCLSPIIAGSRLTTKAVPRQPHSKDSADLIYAHKLSVHPILLNFYPALADAVFISRSLQDPD